MAGSRQLHGKFGWFILLHPSSTGKSDHLLFLRMRWIVRFEVVDLRALYFLKGSAGLR